MKQKMLSVAFRRNPNFPFSSIYTFAVYIQIIVQSKVLNIFIFVSNTLPFLTLLQATQNTVSKIPSSMDFRQSITVRFSNSLVTDNAWNSNKNLSFQTYISWECARKPNFLLAFQTFLCYVWKRTLLSEFQTPYMSENQTDKSLDFR